MTFKEKLVKLRKLKGLTQDDFAKAVGVSRQAVYKWESGQSYPEVSKLLEIKLLFGISIDDLLDESYEVIVPEKKKRKRTVKEKYAAAETLEEKITPAEAEEPEIEAPEQKELPVMEEVLVTAEASVEEEVIESAVAEENTEKPAFESNEESEVVMESEDEGKKKPGFFGRLFGRK